MKDSVINKQSLTILVPTNTREDLPRYLFSEQSLSEMRVLNSLLQVNIAITAQGDYTPYILARTLEMLYEQGLGAGGRYVAEENPARMCYLRQTGAQLFPDSDFYLIMDHNMEMVRHASARRYLQTIDFLNNHMDVAMVFCGSSRGAEARLFGEMIVRYNDAHNSTSRGILLKNPGGGKIFPKECLSLRGSADESVLAVAANMRGFWVYKQWNNPTLHHPENLGERETLERGKTIKNNVHNWDVANENCFRWCKERLGLPLTMDLYGKRFINLQFGQVIG